jgi:hypothetical protein
VRSQASLLIAVDLENALRRQHAAFARGGYDGHNRRSGLTSMHRLGMRRARRNAHRRLWYFYMAAAY